MLSFPYKILKKFMTHATRLIITSRKEKRAAKIKAFRGNATTKEQVRKLVDLDWKRAEYSGVGKKDHVNFQFDFEDINVGRLSLPMQYESFGNLMTFKFEVNPRVGFDDLSSIDAITFNDTEVMGYKSKTFL